LFSLCLTQSVSNVQLKTLWTWSHFSVHKSFNGFIDTCWSIHLVLSCWIIIANETVLTNFVLQDNKRFDFTEWLEKCFNFFFFHVNWDVLEIKIVDQFTEGLSVVFWLEGKTVWITISSFLSIFLVLKADVSETFLTVIWIDRNFKTLDWTILCEVILELLVGNWIIVWRFVEDIVVRELVSVTS